MKAESKCKQCRREGTKLFLKGEKCFGPKCPLVRRQYPPGMHGPKRTRARKLFGYAKQLREKQKAKRTYRLMEHQFKGYVTVAQKKEGDTGKILKLLLEMRLDNAVYRAGFAKSRDQARQIVGHGLIRVNGKKVDIPSYQVASGDEITFKEATLGTKLGESIKKTLEKHVTPSWLSVDSAAVKAKVTSQPTDEDIDSAFEIQPIIEYYSR